MSPNGGSSESATATEGHGDDSGAIGGPSARDGVTFLPADSETTPVLSVVIPTMNEENGIGPTLESVRAGVARLGVPTEVIVCDSSTDRTPEIAREQGAIVVTPDRRGYGAAYRYGFERARGEYIAIGDADASYDFGELPALYHLVAEEGAEMALGSRFSGTIEPGAMPWLHRYVGNPVLTAFLNLFYDLDVTDSHTGFRVVRQDALEDLKLRSDGMEFASEMIMQAGAIGLDIAETPITYHPRIGEAKLETFRDGWRHVEFMLVNAPGYLFSLPGALCSALGLLVLLVVQFEAGFTGIDERPFALVVAALAIVVGYQLTSFGVFSGLITTPIRRPQDPLSKWVERNFDLESGVLSGILLVAVSALALGASLAEGIATGELVRFSPPTVLAVTVVALGTMAVFQAFFFGALIRDRSFDLATEGLPDRSDSNPSDAME